MAAVLPSARPLSQVLHQFREQLSQVIREEADKSSHFEPMQTIAVARAVDISIVNIALAFPSELNKSLDKLEKSLQDRVQIITDWVSQIQGRNRGLYHFLLDIPVFIQRLPITNKLYRMDPPHPILTADHHFSVTFLGEFPDVAYAKCAPLLTFQGKVFSATQATPQKLEFKVQVDPDKLPTVAKNCRQYVEMNLEVLCYTGPSYWATRQTLEFPKLLLGLLPSFAGTLEITTLSLENLPKKETTSSYYKVEAKDADTEQQVGIVPTPGYLIEPKSISFLQDAACVGDREVTYPVLTSERIVVKAKVKKGGSVGFRLRYIEAPTGPQPVQKKLSGNVYWDFPVELSCGEIELGVKFTSFEGQTKALTLQEETTPDYQWKKSPSGYQLKMIAPIYA